jgi:hypothetical protein
VTSRRGLEKPEKNRKLREQLGRTDQQGCNECNEKFVASVRDETSSADSLHSLRTVPVKVTSCNESAEQIVGPRVIALHGIIISLQGITAQSVRLGAWGGVFEASVHGLFRWGVLFLSTHSDLVGRPFLADLVCKVLAATVTPGPEGKRREIHVEQS